MSIVNSPIDLSQLPAPDAIEVVDFEAIYEARKSKLTDLFPRDIQTEVAATLALESEPMSMLLQENGYREMVIRQRINECVRRVLLAFAKGADLEHIGARYYVYRLTVQQAVPEASPPIPEIKEDDDSLLERIQDAYEGLSTAGPRGAYIFHARSADGRVLDARAISPEPCEVIVYVLSSEGDGTASGELTGIVDAALNDEDVRPVCDRLTVSSATIVDYSVKAKLHFKSAGAGRGQALALAQERVGAFVYRRKRQGCSVWLDKLDSLLHVEGVERVEILEPVAHLVLDDSQAARCTGVEVIDADAPVDGQP